MKKIYFSLLLSMLSSAVFKTEGLASEKDFEVSFNNIIFDFEDLDFTTTNLYSHSIVTVSNLSKDKQLFHISAVVYGDGVTLDYVEQDLTLNSGETKDCVFPITLDAQVYNYLEPSNYGVQYSIDNKLIEDSSDIVVEKEEEIEMPEITSEEEESDTGDSAILESDSNETEVTEETQDSEEIIEKTETSESSDEDNFEELEESISEENEEQLVEDNSFIYSFSLYSLPIILKKKNKLS